jgi:hypothetical protein
MNEVLRDTGHINFIFYRACFEVNHHYWPTNELNCIKVNRLKSTS